MPIFVESATLAGLHADRFSHFHLNLQPVVQFPDRPDNLRPLRRRSNFSRQLIVHPPHSCKLIAISHNTAGFSPLSHRNFMRKLLVANRSEIAIRVFRAATELGLGTIAVYTYEDRFALHRFKADESYLIGPPEGGLPVKGYLDIAGIIAVAKEQGADAIHPGYGFLSENAGLARACAANGITFIGPTPEQLETFGDKTAAKRLARQTHVPTVPGTPNALTDPAEIKAAAREIGYPLII